MAIKLFQKNAGKIFEKIEKKNKRRQIKIYFSDKNIRLLNNIHITGFSLLIIIGFTSST